MFNKLLADCMQTEAERLLDLIKDTRLNYGLHVDEKKCLEIAKELRSIANMLDGLDDDEDDLLCKHLDVIHGVCKKCGKNLE